MTTFYFILVILVILVILLLLKISELDITRLDFRKTIKNNEFGTYNEYVHNKLFHLLPPINSKIKILEIGSGNGMSTQRFMKYLNSKGIVYSYTICEYNPDYKRLLKDKFSNKAKVFIGPWEKIYSKYGEKYDIIFTTSISTLNKTNYNKFKELCNNSYIITLTHYDFLFKKHIDRMKFNIISKKRYGLLSLYLVKSN